MPTAMTIIRAAGGSTSLTLKSWSSISRPAAKAIRFEEAMRAATTAATVTAVGRSPLASGCSRSRAMSSLDGFGASSAPVMATGGTGRGSRRRRFRLCLEDTASLPAGAGRESFLDPAAKVLGGPGCVVRVTDRTHDRDALCPGVDHGLHGGRINPADGEERRLCVCGRVAHELETDGRVLRLRRRGVHGPDGDVVAML